MTPHPTSIRLSSQLKDALKRMAKERRWSLNTLIQQVLEAWVRKEEGRK
jgi:predicted transcriptional regulator